MKMPLYLFRATQVVRPVDKFFLLRRRRLLARRRQLTAPKRSKQRCLHCRTSWLLDGCSGRCFGRLAQRGTCVVYHAPTPSPPRRVRPVSGASGSSNGGNVAGGNFAPNTLACFEISNFSLQFISALWEYDLAMRKKSKDQQNFPCSLT
jgi:hypothetical protein